MILHRARSTAGRLLRAAGVRRGGQRAEDQPGQGPVETPGPLDQDLFVNPIAEGADPCVVRDGDRYLWCQSEGNVGVAIWVSDRLTSLGTKHVVWRADAEGPCSQQVWAPELFCFDDRWYVYFAASDGHNSNHLTYVLASITEDVLGPYILHGPLLTGDSTEAGAENVWAIDLTVLEHQQQRYAVWSGWPAPGEDSQHLYIAPMASPVELGGSRVRLCANDDHVWERIDERPRSRGLNEAPQVLARDGRIFVIYSCASSWLPTYKEGMLELVGDDLLDPASWRKHERPIFESTATTYGVGHSGFVTSVDSSQWWHVFHAKRDRQPDWRRALFAQPFSWDDEGLPQFGSPVAAGTPLAVPAGTPQGAVGDAGPGGSTPGRCSTSTTTVTINSSTQPTTASTSAGSLRSPSTTTAAVRRLSFVTAPTPTSRSRPSSSSSRATERRGCSFVRPAQR